MDLKGKGTFHIGINIADVLSKSDRLLEGLIADAETGRKFTPKETRELLKREQEKGYTMFSGSGNLTDIDS
jgi:hypothetical protein